MTLDESIKKYGILNALVVRRVSKNRYRLIDGRNRLGCVSDDSLVPCRIMNEEEVQMIPKNQITVPKRK